MTDFDDEEWDLAPWIRLPIRWSDDPTYGWSEWLIWCDMHQAFHYNEPIREFDDSPPCCRRDWRRVYVERRDGPLPGSALKPPDGRHDYGQRR